MDELRVQISTQRDLQDCSMLCFCETWLGERTPDEAITLDGYTAFREDRSAVDSGKTRGGGTAVLPTYIKRLKAQPVTTKTVNTWTDSAQASLQGCLEATDWNIFKEATDDIHEYTEAVSDYISWCTSTCAPPRTVRVFPNQKPWFNGNIKQKIRKRQEAFKSGDQSEYKKARYELQKSIRAAKRAYSQKLERFYLSNNTRSMWQGIQAVTNYKKIVPAADPLDVTLPDSLNTFYTRFDRMNTDIPSKASCNPTDTVFQVTPTQVLEALRQVNPHKAVGPDGVPPRVMKTCAKQLTEEEVEKATSVCADATDQLKKLSCLMAEFDEARTSPTTKLWLMYMDMVMIFRWFIHAERAGLSEEHLAEVEKMLPNLVAAGHYKYVSCLPHYLEAMRSLSKLAPNTYRELKDGKFNVRQTEGRSNGVWKDMALEKT
ncbi:unnamed protein product [Leuciscus chuanchicus]